ncbi:hypothetical protein [Bdellovibrio sp. GT3]|uniref:hypothetical protein n=1 Tax=Bdellovibrio sp. GT3 TaxID=3136282 RepID=UPI0030F3EF33
MSHSENFGFEIGPAIALLFCMQNKTAKLKKSVVYVTIILTGVNVLLTAAQAVSGEQETKARSFHNIAWEKR